MPYLIDGHNLIGSLPGLSLADPEDERKLLDLLRAFGRSTRRKSVVFFDRGRPGTAPQLLSGGMVQAIFVPPPRRADDAILDFLRTHKDARHYTVVSSDSEVRAKSRRADAKVVSSAEFARELDQSLTDRRKEKPPEEMKDLEQWLRLFGG
jgi:predicted RNA-binding protein with PIN domain